MSDADNQSHDSETNDEPSHYRKSNEAIAVLSQLIGMQVDRFKQTRDIEFKVNVGIWAAMITGLFAVLSKVPGYCLRGDERCYAFWLGFAICIVHFVWMILIHLSECTDSAIAHRYRQRLEDLIVLRRSARAFPDRLTWCDKQCKCWKQFKRSRCFRFFRGATWISCEVGVTAVLYWAVYLALTRCRC